MKPILALVALLLALPTAAQRRAHLDYEPSDPAALPANLFLRKPVTASGHWSDRVPAFAVDGDASDPGAHWACENNPTWLTVDLGATTALDTIHLTTYWDGARRYDWKIEGSDDGAAWRTLVARNDTRGAATAAGAWLTFPRQSVRYVRTTLLANSAGDRAGGHIVEIEGFAMDPARAAKAAAWETQPAGLHGTIGTLDRRYPKDEVPARAGLASLALDAWRGERVHAQLVVWSAAPAGSLRIESTKLYGPGDATIAPNVRFVRYVRADRELVADILDDAETVEMDARTVRPIWYSVEVPQGAPPGTYRGQVSVVGSNGRWNCPVFIEVLPATLPPPKQWSFYLDLWQNPYALARWHRVKPFSPEHLALMRPHLEMAANAGQKVLTTTLIDAPWGGQTFDPYGAMVDWVRQPDGAFRWDYTLFDRYVAFGKSCGVGPYVNCYSMIPWTNRLRYRDAVNGTYGYLDLKPGDPSYEKVWGPFLTDFQKHLKVKGWLGQVRIAMDERPLPVMQAAWAVVKKYAPDIPIALAGDNNPAFADAVTDWCAYLTPGLDPKTLAARTAKGLPTTFYVCCSPGRPNTFTNSPPAESTWIGLFAAGHGYTGFLRWAFDSWTEDPFFDTKHVTWDPGDCFLVYPGGRSSIRFERLREGIQEYEKVAILRKKLAGTPALAAVDAALAKLTVDQVQTTEPLAPVVNAAKAAIAKASQRL